MGEIEFNFKTVVEDGIVNNGDTFYYPYLLEDYAAYPASVHFTFYERLNTGTSEPRNEVFLYMPPEFGQPNTVTWDSSFRGGQAVLSAIDASPLPGAKSVANAMSEMQQKISTMSLDGMTAGMMMNPFLAQNFRAVDFRNFQFTFKFVPYDYNDCYNIYKIIKTFRKWSLPSAAMPEYGLGAFSLRFNYPGEVDVHYLFSTGENQFLHQFKRSVITGIDISYTGAGMWAMMRNGFPAETTMVVSFSETVVVLRDDVSNNIDGGRF